MSHPYVDALMKFGRQKVDMTYIRNPDLVNEWDWSSIYGRALEFTERSGVVVTLIRESDVRRFQTVASVIKQRFGAEPIISQKTGMTLDDRTHDNFHHYIGIHHN